MKILKAQHMRDAEREFLEASVAVWREIDRLTEAGPYKGLDASTDLRIRERQAWERYRAELDREMPR